MVGDGVKERLPEPVRLKQMAELADGGLVRDRPVAQIDPDKGPHDRRVVQRFLHRGVGQIEPVLEEVQPQHALQSDGRATVPDLGVHRFDVATQLAPRHDAIHLGEEPCPARHLGVLIEAGPGPASAANGSSFAPPVLA